MKKVGLFLFAVVMGLFVSASTSYGATIYACKKKVGGTIRIVGARTTCLDTESKISWPDTTELTALKNRLAALESLLQHFSRNGNDISIVGANLWIKDGSGDTGSEVNGLGNLIIGYNEARPEGNVRAGSHNLVIGDWQNYGSFGGMVVGAWGTIAGPYASVSGGYANSATGGYSSVSGGSSNTASGVYSSVSGGWNNRASGSAASVVGGGGSTPEEGNLAFSNYSSVLGGSANTAGDPSNPFKGMYSTVSGGSQNIAAHHAASVSGGFSNAAKWPHSSVSGGSNNTADMDFSSVSGGYSNTAYSSYSSVSGGYENYAVGTYSSVSGGKNRMTSPFSYVWRAGNLEEPE